MRYYIYLDRSFLRILFSSLEDNNFNIEIVEYAVRESNAKKNSIAVSPHLDKSNDCEEVSRDFKESEKSECTNRNGTFNKEHLGLTFDHENNNYCETERRYINIQDITEMKNSNFYHKLTEQIRDTSRSADNRIYEETGYITPYNIRSDEDPINGFFLINNTSVWYDKTILEGDIELLSKMSCKIRVIGYTMNCLERNDRKVIKAIAIFID